MIVPPAGTTKLAGERMAGVKEKVEMECQDWFFCFRKK